jgi:hypothetical protein
VVAVGIVCGVLLLLNGLPGVAEAASPVKALNIGLSVVTGYANSITTYKTSDPGSPNYIMFYSFNSSNEKVLTGNFSVGSGCSGGCSGADFPFPSTNTSTIKFWLMDNQTVSGKPKLYPVYINGKSDSFSLTVYGTDTAYWCIKALKSCDHTYGLTGTTTSSVPRSANVSLAVSEGPILSSQGADREALYSNYTELFYQLGQTCPSLSYNQASVDDIAGLILIPIDLGVFGVDDYPFISALEVALDLHHASEVDPFFYGANSWNASIEFPNGVPNLPFLCTNIYYTMQAADGGNLPPVYTELNNMEILVNTELGLVNSSIKPNNATLLTNLNSQNSTITSALQDLAGLNSTLTTFVQIPSSCGPLYYGGWNGMVYGPCAPYAQYLISTFMTPMSNALVSDLNYTSGTYRVLSAAK